MQLSKFVDNEATMSSKEIAKLTGKQHGHVRVDVEKLVYFYTKKYSAEKAADLVKSGTYKDSTGRSNPCFHLPIEMAFTLILSYKNKDCNLQLITKLCGDSKNLAAIVSALRDFDFSEVPEEMFVYVARNADTGNIKIGLSKQPEERIKQLQVGCDGKLELLGCIPAPNRYKDETAYHRKFISSNIHSEWFTSDAAEIILN